MPDCLSKTLESVRKHKLTFWDRNRETNRAWLALNMTTEAKAGFRDFNEGPRGRREVDFVELRRRKVLMETVKRFKGLEAPIAFLWGIDGLDPEKDAETLYVGLSRPKSILGLVGQPESCERLLAQGASSK